jgi:hypothetical protein
VTVLGWLVLLLVWTLVSSTLVVLGLLVTNPVMIGPAGVTVWFLLVLSGMAAGLTLLLYSVKTYLHVHTAAGNRLRYSWRQGMLIAGWGTGMLALSSLRQLGFLDAILLALLLVIVEVYVRLRWP